MARGRRKGRGGSHTANDGVLDPLRDELLPSLSWDPTPVRPSAVRSTLSEVEDRREWHPDPVAPLRSPRRWRHRLVLPQPQVVSPARPARFGESATKIYSPTVPAFHSPKTLALCIRRKQRREVLLAIGKGGGRHRRPRRNKWSSVKC